MEREVRLMKDTAGASLEDYIVVKGNQKGKGKGKKGSKVVEDLEKVDGNEGDNRDEEDEERKDGDGEAGEERSSDQIFKSVLSICPVCGEFEGDEVAVAHHVNGHFD
ncbi:d278b8d2-3d16-47a1-8a33-c7edab118cec-CDS [Sclerotinia trifoliorum]|uniref:D278b8d2-3d16-47a1-8a33-c7edab118cec-CDS n=1 Tax=Sclerotinia trifoliorum TaxID=28548 RepID=A0A8H2VRR9_9HELO|nr:d278b8d2-3d16-47a1-8a33-c7edab118cec-CDS [Sclerotinia trifoliorum]